MSFDGVLIHRCNILRKVQDRKLKYKSGTAAFTVGETVTSYETDASGNAVLDASGNMIQDASGNVKAVSGTAATGYLQINSVDGAFTNGQIIQGSLTPIAETIGGNVATATLNASVSDVSGNNVGSSITAETLEGIGFLTNSFTTKTITQEFTIINDSLSHSPLTIDNCDATTGWTAAAGTLTSLTVESGMLKVVGTTDGTGRLQVVRDFSGFDLTNYPFISVFLKCDTASDFYLYVGSDLASSNYVYFSGTRFPTNTTGRTYVLPLKAPAKSTGQNPGVILGTPNFASMKRFRVGVTDAPFNTSITMYINTLQVDVGKAVYVEVDTPMNLADTSALIQHHNGSTYATCRICKLDTVYTDVTITDANAVFNDGTVISDVYGAGLGRSVFPKGILGQTVTGSLAASTLTYAAIPGTSRRIGFMVQMPPSDGGRTNFNKVRKKILVYYRDSTYQAKADGADIAFISSGGQPGYSETPENVKCRFFKQSSTSRSGVVIVGNTQYFKIPLSVMLPATVVVTEDDRISTTTTGWAGSYTIADINPIYGARVIHHYNVDLVRVS